MIRHTLQLEYKDWEFYEKLLQCGMLISHRCGISRYSFLQAGGASCLSGTSSIQELACMFVVNVAVHRSPPTTCATIVAGQHGGLENTHPAHIPEYQKVNSFLVLS